MEAIAQSMKVTSFVKINSVALQKTEMTTTVANWLNVLLLLFLNTT